MVEAAQRVLWIGVVLACGPACGLDGEVPDTEDDAGLEGSGDEAESGGEQSSETGSTGNTSSDPDSGDDAPGDGSSTGEDPEPEWVYPDPDWATEPPEDHGMDPEALALTSEIAAAYDTSCLVVTRHGVIVHEWYDEGWDATRKTEIFSVTKSVTSTLVGIAQDEGLLHVNDFAADYIAPWAGTASAGVTIGNLLRMDSGRYWEFLNDYVQLDTIATDKSDFAVDLSQQHPPGTWWEYNNAAVQTLEPVLREAVGGDVAEWAQGALLDPIGMDATFGRDLAGNTIMYAHMQGGCRAMARLGYLYLRGGQWAGGTQVVSESWVQAATMPGTELNSAYGMLWWLNRPGHYVKPSTPERKEGDGPIIPEAPIGIFTAQGVRAQLVAVDPEHEIVFTRLAAVPLQDLFSGTPVEGELWAAIMASIIE
jgi:CubicO group peptidase (beta-lactamase class C family)